MTAIDIREDLTMRAPTLDDIDALVDLINTVSLREVGAVLVDRDHMVKEWTAPGSFNLATDARLLFDPQGKLIGEIEMWNEEPLVHPQIWGTVHPDYHGLGIGAHLFAWAEARAALEVAQAPPEARVAAQTSAHHSNTCAAELFRRHGYQLIRRFWRMRIDFDPDCPPQAPVWPEGITLRPYVPGQDDHAVYEAVEDSFADHWGYTRDPFDRWLHWMTTDADFDPSLWFLAVDGEDIAGVVLCRPRMPEDADLGWVRTLGVRRPWRRRGLALALLRHAFGALYRRGKPRAGLGVDAANLTGATRLYEKAGMHVSRQWDVYEKELRPGVEITTRSLAETLDD